MRRLIYVPIIHINTDLGSLAPEMEKWANEVAGGENWRNHQKVVNLYWHRLAGYWESKKVLGVKIFQDGTAANGAIGKKIVKELAQKGSINYQIIENLLQKGAELVKTEDPVLLKEEYFLTKELVERKSFLGGLLAFLRYKWRKGGLLAKRDSFIAKRIDESLQEGETGICFLGVYHQMLQKLPSDFTVVYLKNPQKIKEYYQKLISRSREGEINRLGRWLVEPIKIPLGEKYD